MCIPEYLISKYLSSKILFSEYLTAKIFFPNRRRNRRNTEAEFLFSSYIM